MNDNDKSTNLSQIDNREEAEVIDFSFLFFAGETDPGMQTRNTSLQLSDVDVLDARRTFDPASPRIHAEPDSPQILFEYLHVGISETFHWTGNYCYDAKSASG